MASNLIVLTILGTIVLLTLGLIVAMGVVVYKDAKAHDMQALLWAAVAVLVPNFIGLIIYLVVRSNQEKKFQCSNCRAEVQKDYNVCPNCKAVFDEICSTCKHAVSSQMHYCPYCGEEIHISEHSQTASKITKKTNIVKPLAIIGILFVFTLVMFIIVMTPIGAAAYTGQKEVSVMCVETNSGSTRKASFKYKDGESVIHLKKETGDSIILNTQISLTAGNVELTLLGPDKQSIYHHVYEGNVLPEKLTFEAAADGQYLLELKVNKASGSYEIKAE